MGDAQQPTAESSTKPGRYRVVKEPLDLWKSKSGIKLQSGIQKSVGEEFDVTEVWHTGRFDPYQGWWGHTYHRGRQYSVRLKPDVQEQDSQWSERVPVMDFNPSSPPFTSKAGWHYTPGKYKVLSRKGPLSKWNAPRIGGKFRSTTEPPLEFGEVFDVSLVKRSILVDPFQGWWGKIKGTSLWVTLNSYEEEEEWTTKLPTPSLQLVCDSVGEEISLSPEHIHKAVLLASWIYQPELPNLLEDSPEREALEQAGLQMIMHQLHDVHEINLTQWVVTKAPDFGYFVAWRGTTSVLEFLADASLTPFLLETKAGVLGLHAGFRTLMNNEIFHHKRELKKLFDVVSRASNENDRRVTFVGHSLGGALAGMAVLQLLLAKHGEHDLLKDWSPPENVQVMGITFAAPSILFSQCAVIPPFLSCLHKQWLNFIFGNDIVGRLPHDVRYLKNEVPNSAGLLATDLALGNLKQAFEAAARVCVREVAGDNDQHNIYVLMEKYQVVCKQIYLNHEGPHMPADVQLKFDPEMDKQSPGSLITHHLVAGYVAAITRRR